MAGDWLKFDKATPDKPEVLSIAVELGLDPDAVVGKLMRVWSWFDTHTKNGNAAGVTPELLDRIAGVPGFVRAMVSVRWMEARLGGCVLPNFGRHCGETAKSRSLGARRSAAFRVRNASTVTDALPREEKRREEEQKHESSNEDSRRQPADDKVCELVLRTYHDRLPACQRIDALTPKRRKRILTAHKLARKLCKDQGWTMTAERFWGAYFDECADDPWMRGDVPNPNNPRWKQNLFVLIAEDRFAEIMDRAIAAVRGDA